VVPEKLTTVVGRIGEIAAGVQSKLRWFLAIGFIATLILLWQAYTPDGALWWNITKCGLISMPVLILGFVWSVLNQLREAPSLVAELTSDDKGLFANFDELSIREPNGLRGVFSTVAAFRREDGLSVVFDTIGGISLIANPVFALLAFIAMGLLLMLILIAPLALLL